MAVSAGIDVVEVADVKASLGRFGERYLRRLFTPAEISAYVSGGGPVCLAGCFAAKEAALKALVVPGESVADWRSIEAREREHRHDPALCCCGRDGRQAGRGRQVEAGMTTDERIRRIIAEQGSLTVDVGRLSDADDLFAAGMTSHASVNVMLGLESEFDLEFPDDMLNRSVFSSVAAIRDAVSRLGAQSN
jgi:acyl carrier protein